MPLTTDDLPRGGDRTAQGKLGTGLVWFVLTVLGVMVALAAIGAVFKYINW